MSTLAPTTYYAMVEQTLAMLREEYGADLCFTVSEAGRILGISLFSVHYWDDPRRAGPFPRVGGKRLLTVEHIRKIAALRTAAAARAAKRGRPIPHRVPLQPQEQDHGAR